MADLDGDFRFLAQSARRFVGLLAERSPSPVEADKRGSILRAHVEETAAGVETRISSVEGEYGQASDDTDRLEAIKQMRLLAGYAHFMQRALPWLEDSARSPLELGALYLLDEMAGELLGEVADVVPTRSDEFSTEQRPFEPLFPALKLAAPSGPRPIILNFPSLDKSCFLLLPIYGHELGHTAVVMHKMLAPTLAPLRADANFTTAFNAARDELAKRQNITPRRASYLINQKLELWTTELLCDQIGLQYLGPSFLLTLSTYLIALGWNDPGPRHPPTTLRVAHCLAWIEENSWAPFLEGCMPTAFEWIREVGRAPRKSTVDPIDLFLIEAVEEVAPEVSAIVAGHLGSSTYLPAAYDPVSSHLQSLLDNEILPVQHPETDQPFDRRAILTVGWASIYAEAMKEGAGDTSRTLCLALTRDRSHEFFTKALEMAVVLANWRAI